MTCYSRPLWCGRSELVGPSETGLFRKLPGLPAPQKVRGIRCSLPRLSIFRRCGEENLNWKSVFMVSYSSQDVWNAI